MLWRIDGALEAFAVAHDAGEQAHAAYECVDVLRVARKEIEFLRNEVDRLRFALPYDPSHIPDATRDGDLAQLRRFASGLWWAVAQGPEGRSAERAGVTDGRLAETFDCVISVMTHHSKEMNDVHIGMVPPGAPAIDTASPAEVS